MADHEIAGLRQRIAGLKASRRVGRVTALHAALIHASGLDDVATLGDRVLIRRRDGSVLPGEVMGIGAQGCSLLADGRLSGVSLGDSVVHDGPAQLSPDDSWIGRIIDPEGQPLDGRPLLPGQQVRPYQTDPPQAGQRRGLGARLEAGLPVFNTFLPLARGQRLGLFSGSGVGKSSLLAALARNLEADVVVIGLIGERGREVRHFVDTVLGKEGMARSVIVAATSDRSALSRRRCAWACMAVAEHFRDRGRQVLLLADSITRFAEAHRDIALACGEPASLQGYPPSLPQQIMELAERAGPGEGTQGDITALFTVLVAGSDMEGPVADTLRGTLDGHVILDRSIAERGRYPAIDLLRSVSRSLPDVGTQSENALLLAARGLLATFHRAELMIQSGLYTSGSDPNVDMAIAHHAGLDGFLANAAAEPVSESFRRLAALLPESLLPHTDEADQQPVPGPVSSPLDIQDQEPVGPSGPDTPAKTVTAERTALQIP